MNENSVNLPGIFSEGYGIIPKKLMKMKIGIIEIPTNKKIIKVKGSNIKLVISYMLSYTGAGKTECFPSIKTIAEDLEISKDTVVYAIKAAEKICLLQKEQMYPNNPLKHNNKYIISCLSNDIPNLDIRHSRFTASGGSNFKVVTIEQNNNSYNNNSFNNNNSDALHAGVNKGEKKKTPCKKVPALSTTLRNQHACLLEKHGITYIPTVKEIIAFNTHIKKYESIGGGELNRMMAFWFEEQIGAWCGYRITNFHSDIAKITANPKWRKKNRPVKKNVDLEAEAEMARDGVI